MDDECALILQPQSLAIFALDFGLVEEFAAIRLLATSTQVHLFPTARITAEKHRGLTSKCSPDSRAIDDLAAFSTTDTTGSV